MVEGLLPADLVEPPPLVLRLPCELAFAELLLELFDALLLEPVAFFCPDDELFAPDDERELLPVLVCAMARPPSTFRLPPLLRGHT